MLEEHKNFMNEEHNKGNVEELKKQGFLHVLLPLRKALLYNLLGGMAWGFGVVLGATVLVGLALSIFGALGNIPVIGKIFNTVLERSDQVDVFDIE
ncbi:MAG: DUF5665 domain-containing protein, partial [bacterium]|nr:DUF5665 domain-containing protein [bacterium]